MGNTDLSYEKLLSPILSGLDTRSAHRLRAIFGWIAFAKRPLRKAELQSALIFQPEEVIGDRPVPAQILERCKPLIEERRDSTLAFIHISVKEYVRRIPPSEQDVSITPKSVICKATTATDLSRWKRCRSAGIML